VLFMGSSWVIVLGSWVPPAGELRWHVEGRGFTVGTELAFHLSKRKGVGQCSRRSEVKKVVKKKIKIKIKGLGDDMENQPKRGSCGRMGSLPKGCCCSSKQGGQRWKGWTLFYFDGRCRWCWVELVGVAGVQEMEMELLVGMNGELALLLVGGGVG